MQKIQGLLVHGDNHFVVQGPLPANDVALELVRHWSIIQIGSVTPPHLAPWSIITRAFREDLTWAVIAAGQGDPSPAVATLLQELSAHGIEIHHVKIPKH